MQVLLYMMSSSNLVKVVINRQRVEDFMTRQISRLDFKKLPLIPRFAHLPVIDVAAVGVGTAVTYSNIRQGSNSTLEACESRTLMGRTQS